MKREEKRIEKENTIGQEKEKRQRKKKIAFLRSRSCVLPRSSVQMHTGSAKHDKNSNNSIAVIHPAVGCHYFPPGLWLPSQPQSITALWLVLILPSYGR